MSICNVRGTVRVVSHRTMMRSLDHVSPTTVSAGLLRWLSGKEHTCRCRRRRKHEFASRVGGFPGEGNGEPLQYSYLKNPVTKESGGLQPMGSHFLATKQKWCNSSCSCHIELTVVCAITAIMRSWRENQDSGTEAYQYLSYHYTPAIYWTLQLSTTRMIDCYMSVHSFKGNMNWIFYY